MPLSLSWSEIAIRLLCAFAAGTLVGLNRSEHGRAAGLRTSTLLCLAACVAMIQVNLLLPLAGRPSNSFVMNDLMRLPLGILSGMGFIGAGAIVRRDNFVAGVTTAATMWFLTVIGLCFGGGQMALGTAGVLLAIFVLAGMKLVEDRMKQDHQAKLVIVTNLSGPRENEIRAILEGAGLQIAAFAFDAAPLANSRELTWELRWRAKPNETTVPYAVERLTAHEGVIRMAWTPRAI